MTIRLRCRSVRTALAAGLLLAAAPDASRAQSPPAEPRTYLADGVYQESGRIVFERDGATASESLGSWRLTGDAVGQHLGLERRDDKGAAIRVLDASGREIGTATIGPGQDAVVSDRGVVVVPRALHGPTRPHELDFLSLDGRLLRSVSEPELTIVKWRVQPDGALVTVNRGPGEAGRTIVVYAPDGALLWRYTPAGEGFPDALVTPDGHRLFVLDHHPSERVTDVTILSPDNQVVKQHQLPLVTDVVASANGRRVAAVGWGGAQLLDADSGEIRWRNPKVGGVLKGGLRFDADGKQLLVVEGASTAGAATTTLRLRRIRLRDGADSRTDVGAVPSDRVPAVRDIHTGTDRKRRIVMHDRVLTVPPAGAARTP